MSFSLIVWLAFFLFAIRKIQIERRNIAFQATNSQNEKRMKIEGENKNRQCILVGGGTMLSERTRKILHIERV